ncbi:methyltransferase domain-containing protein [Penicillium odoratum]|uniref:methyltransferase domain-containing protein n=1 Tax=Penicillium odoratum TaxID=1167516 RepID=UPI00254864DF|nr:methyltransferase domain-containing protein [Penicillium odoratum]KAJ5745661.1 methyltransferase domain-containing protein [Penicillium odoratum]
MTVEQQRLNDNHRVFKQMTNGKLLPMCIERHLRSLSAPVVADIATGTGNWLFDLARELPSLAQLDGYDIDSSKYLATELQPRNVALHVHDVLNPFHESLRGRYDAVHIRLLYLALRADDWTTVAANVKYILKPGGWIFWEELGYPAYSCVPMSASFAELFRIEGNYGIQVGRNLRAPVQLMSQLKGEGYANCDQQTFNSLAIEESSFTDSIGRGVTKLLEVSMSHILKKGGNMSIRSEEDIDALVKSLLMDLEQ